MAGSTVDRVNCLTLIRQVFAWVKRDAAVVNLET
jgi:hypothetical protein